MRRILTAVVAVVCSLSPWGFPERPACAGITSRVSVSSGGAQGNAYSYRPSMSSDGRYVAFESGASNLVPGDTNGYHDVFVYDRQTGQTTRVSVSSSNAQGNSFSEDPSISSDGRYVTFYSTASNLVAGDTNHNTDVFVRDLQSGYTSRVSVSSPDIGALSVFTNNPG